MCVSLSDTHNLKTLLSLITKPQTRIASIIMANFTCAPESYSISGLETPHIPTPINIGKNLYEPWQSQHELSASHVSNLWEKITIKRYSKIDSVRMVLLELHLSHSEREDKGEEGFELTQKPWQFSLNQTISK